MKFMLILLSSSGQHELVAHAIFTYIALLQESSSASLNRLYEELSYLGTIKYCFSESVSSLGKFVSDLSVRLTTSKAPQEWLLSQPHLFRQFDERIIRETLGKFTVEGCRIVIGCQHIPDGADGGWNQVEPIYQTRYRTEKLSSAFNELVRPICEIKLHVSDFGRPPRQGVCYHSRHSDCPNRTSTFRLTSTSNPQRRV
jgi:hypothetical protein